MAPGVLDAIARLSSQKRSIQSQLRRASCRKERAWEAFKRAEAEYLRVKEAADRDLERIKARDEELNILFGSKASRNAAEVRDLTAGLVLETLLARGTESDGDDNDYVPVSKSSHAKAMSHNESTLPNHKRVAPARNKREAAGPSGRASQMFNFQGAATDNTNAKYLVTESETGSDSDASSSDEDRYSTTDGSNHEPSNPGIRNQRELSIGSNIVVARPETPPVHMEGFSEEIAPKAEHSTSTLLSEAKTPGPCRKRSDSVYSDSTDGLFVSENKRTKDSLPGAVAGTEFELMLGLADSGLVDRCADEQPRLGKDLDELEGRTLPPPTTTSTSSFVYDAGSKHVSTHSHATSQECSDSSSGLFVSQRSPSPPRRIVKKPKRQVATANCTDKGRKHQNSLAKQEHEPRKRLVVDTEVSQDRTRQSSGFGSFNLSQQILAYTTKR